jgi:hypothetical protein
MTSMAEHQPAIEQSNSGLSDKYSDVYRKLKNDPKQIRVLEIHAGAGTEDIRCTLRCICLTEEPQTKYETVSYAWGDKSQREYLFVNGVHINAPASSVKVLRRIRLLHKSRVVWIDAICINQTDIEERSQQVEIMGLIYARTVRNLIWLGEEDCDTASAIYSIAAISIDIKHEAKDSDRLRDILYPSHLSQRASNAAGGMGPRISVTDLTVEVDQRALRRFFSSAWFSRLWVCQEASLSPESVCYKGSFECDVKDVLKAALWIRYKQRHLPLTWDACTERAADLADWADRNIGYIRTVYGSTVPPGIALASLLWSLRNFEAGDPRDRVYAVIGLCEAYSQTRTNIVPNYGTDTADAFRAATKFIIEDTGDLRIFRDICRRLDDKDESTFTTWVPRYDWKRDNSREPYRLITVGQNADGGERMAMNQHSGPGELLILRGLDLDTIRCRTATPRESDTAATILHFLNSVEQLVACTVEGVPQATRNIIAKILRGGRLAADPNAGEDGDVYTEFKRLLVQQAAQSAHGMAKGATGDGGVAAFRTAFTLTCHARCFFRTDSGYLGVGPHTLQVGDAVTIIYGSSLPLILRRSTTHIGEFQLVGVSYVYGIMNGEAVHQHRERSRDPIEMRIR